MASNNFGPSMLPHFVIVTRRVLTVVSEPAVPVDDGVYHVVRYIRTGDDATMQVRFHSKLYAVWFVRDM